MTAEDMLGKVLTRLDAIEERRKEPPGIRELKDLILRLTSDLAKHTADELERFGSLEERLSALEEP